MNAPASLPPEAIQRLITPTEPWLSCDDCFDQLDEVVEDVVTRRAPIGEPFVVHLRACSVCREEAYSLIDLVSADYGVAAARAAADLDAVLLAESGRPRSV